MQITNIFKKNREITIYRRNKLEELKKKSPIITQDFLNYGFDYFDNPVIKSGYNKYINDRRYKKVVEKIIKKFKIDNKTIIAEFGCAKGFLLEEFKKKKFDVLGFEKSHYAKKNSSIKNNIKIIRELKNINKFNFDFLICKNVLPHMKLREVHFLIRTVIKKSKYKPYFIIHTYNNKKNKNLFLRWDRTHKILFNKSDWISFLKRYNNQIYYSLDILF